jgi:hypothetical protein
LRAVVVSLVVLTGTGLARAEDAPPFELEWRAPAGCPTSDRLRAEITRLIGANAHPEGTTHVSGEVNPQENGTFLVKLELEQNGHPGERTLTGATCAEVSRAAALLIALAIAPDAAHDEAEPEPPPPAPPPRPPPAPPPSPPPAPPKPSPPSERHFVIALGAATEVGLLPALSPGGEISLGASVDRFSFEVYGDTYENQDHAAQAGSGGGHFSLSSAGARACALLAPGDLSFAACLGGAAHHVAARGYGVEEPSSESTNVGALSLAVRVELSLSHHASLRLDAGPSYLLGKANFVLSNSANGVSTSNPVYEATPLDAGGSLKLAWRF